MLYQKFNADSHVTVEFLFIRVSVATSLGYCHRPLIKVLESYIKVFGISHGLRTVQLKRSLDYSI